jgi:hypothetical protein
VKVPCLNSLKFAHAAVPGLYLSAVNIEWPLPVVARSLHHHRGHLPAPPAWWSRSRGSLASAASGPYPMAPGSSRPARPCRYRCRTPGPGTAVRRSPIPRVPTSALPALASLRGGTAQGTGGRAEESNPRVRSDNERPLGRPVPRVRLIRGLDRTKKATTSRAVPPPFFTPVRRRASGTKG